jgi:hypothetical protein
LYGTGLRGNGRNQLNVAASPATFFFDDHDLKPIVSILRERLPHEAGRCLAEADHIRKHCFDLLGYNGVQYGEHIDWSLDAVNGVRAPHKPWYKIGYLNFGDVGDPKVIWELNRHQHLVTLAKAALISGDRGYTEELVRQWSSWREQNPYPVGINWASSLEVAFRSLSWLWVRQLTGLALGSSVAGRDFERQLMAQLAVSGRHIERYLSTYSSPNTHLLGEAVGLFFIGTLCPGLRSAARWQRLGWDIICREAERQVRADGAHFEQSTYYHVYALDMLLHARTLAFRNGISIPESLDLTLLRMLEFLAGLAQSGPPTRLGDDDGGRLFNPRRNRAEHLLDPLATGAALYHQSSLKATACGLREETVWLLGPDGVASFDSVPAASTSSGSRKFDASGTCIISDKDAQTARLTIDAGPLGGGTGGHGHADALSLTLSVDGREWLTDPGTFCYSSREPGLRDSFRGTAAHNTLQVDGSDQAEPAGPFGWKQMPETQVDEWSCGECFTRFEGSHCGYQRFSSPVVHRRSVLRVAPGPGTGQSPLWLIRDRAEGSGAHHLAVRWHLGEGVTALKSRQAFVLTWNSSALAMLAPEEHAWNDTLDQAWISPAYGARVDATVIRWSRQALLPVEFAVLVRVLPDPKADAGIFANLRASDAGARADLLGVGGYCYTFEGWNHYFLWSDQAGAWAVAQWSSDARFLYCCTSPDESVHRWIVSHGSYVTVEGRRLIALERPIERFEWEGREGDGRIFCSDPSRVREWRPR